MATADDPISPLTSQPNDTVGKPIFFYERDDTPPATHPQGMRHFLIGPTRCNCSATVPATDDVCPVGGPLEGR